MSWRRNPLLTWASYGPDSIVIEIPIQIAPEEKELLIPYFSAVRNIGEIFQGWEHSEEWQELWEQSTPEEKLAFELFFYCRHKIWSDLLEKATEVRDGSGGGKPE